MTEPAHRHHFVESKDDETVLVCECGSKLHIPIAAELKRQIAEARAKAAKKNSGEG